MSKEQFKQARQQATRDLFRLMRRINFHIESPGVSPHEAGLYLLQQWQLIQSQVWSVYAWSFMKRASGRPAGTERTRWRHTWETLVKEVLGKNPPYFEEDLRLVSYINDVQVRPLLSSPAHEGTSLSFEALARTLQAKEDSPLRTRQAERLAAEYLWEHYPDSRSQQWLADLCQEAEPSDLKEIREERPAKAAEIEAARAKAYRRISRARMTRRQLNPVKTKQLRAKKRGKRPISR